MTPFTRSTGSVACGVVEIRRAQDKRRAERLVQANPEVAIEARFAVRTRERTRNTSTNKGPPLPSINPQPLGGCCRKDGTQLLASGPARRPRPTRPSQGPAVMVTSHLPT